MDQVPQIPVFVAAADDIPDGQSPRPGVPRAHGQVKIAAHHGNIHVLFVLRDSRPGKLAENAEQHSDPHGGFRPAAVGAGAATPQLLCENVYQMVKRPFRIVPAFPGNNSLGQIHQSDGIAPDAEFHIPPGQLRIEQPVQHLGDALMKGFLFQSVDFLPGENRLPERHIQSAVRPPVFPQDTLGGVGIPVISRGHIQHIPSLQWHCSRKCCPPFLPPARAPADAGQGQASSERPQTRQAFR